MAASASGYQDARPHQAVLVEQVLEFLSPVPDGRYLDGTIGFGGHAAAILEKTEGASKIVGLDQDVQALEWTGRMLGEMWPRSRVELRHERFSRFPEVLEGLGWDRLDGVLLDLGFSSLQVDTPERGFSFLADGPLDMRMNPQGTVLTAREVVNAYPVRELARIIGDLGEEPLAGRIARRIDEYRQYAHIGSTLELAEIVERAYPPARRAQARNHPATRTFQALRMFVNDEVGELTRFLDEIVPYLAERARVAVISFHSIEDRIVKHFFLNHSKTCLCPPRQPYCTCGHKATLKVLTRKPVMASEAENMRNPRSRSAKLRVAERI